MTDHILTDISGRKPGVDRLRRWRRLSRRVIYPLLLLCLIYVLSLNGFAGLAGQSASLENPYLWSQDSVFIAGGSQAGTYTSCRITPEQGERRRVDIPGDDTGIHLEPWFTGTAKISCGHTVSVTSGWQTSLYPLAFNKPLLFILAIFTLCAWWFGRKIKQLK